MMFRQPLQNFGYLASFLGTFSEGEAILVLVGFLILHGYMQLDTMILAAFLGSCAGDQLWYFLERRHGRRLLAHKPHWQKLGDKALDHVRRHPDLWALSFRFVYGLRTVIPVAIGLFGCPSARYLLLSGISAIIRAAVLGSAAYYSDSVLKDMLGNIKKYEPTVLGGLIMLSLLFWLQRCFKIPCSNGVGGNADRSE